MMLNLYSLLQNKKKIVTTHFCYPPERQLRLSSVYFLKNTNIIIFTSIYIYMLSSVVYSKVHLFRQDLDNKNNANLDKAIASWGQTWCRNYIVSREQNLLCHDLSSLAGSHENRCSV